MGGQNTLESLPTLLALSIAGGLKHPIACALAGLLWSFSRIQWAKVPTHPAGNPGANPQSISHSCHLRGWNLNGS